MCKKIVFSFVIGLFFVFACASQIQAQEYEVLISPTLKNGGFENGSIITEWKSAGTGYIKADNNTKYNGNYSGLLENKSNDLWFRGYQEFEAKKGDIFKGQVYVKKSSNWHPGCHASIIIEFHNELNQLLMRFESKDEVTTQYDWVLCEIEEVMAPENTKYVRFVLNLEKESVQLPYPQANFDDCFFEKKIRQFGNLGGLELELKRGNPGDLVANTTVMSSTTGLSFDEPFTDPALNISTTLHSPWWFIAGDYGAYVTMKNTQSYEITVTPTIYYEGGSYQVEDIVIPAHETRFFNVKTYEENLEGKTYGGIELNTGTAGAVVANTTVMSSTTGLSFDEPFTDPALNISTTLHSPWWFIAGDYGAYVTMKNTQSYEITVTPTIYYEGGSYQVEDIVIPAHETRFFNVKTYEENLEGKTYGGIELNTGTAGAVVANTTVMSSTTGLSFDEPFTDPALNISTTLHSPWWFIAGDYGAYVTMKNTQSYEITVTPTIYYEGGSYQVEDIVIPAHETRFFNVKTYEENLEGKTYGGIELNTGTAGAVVANTTVMSSTTGLSFDEPFTDPALNISTTLHSPWWFIASDYSAYVTLKNTGNYKIEVTPTIYYENGSYEIDTISIPVNETRFFNVKDWIK